MMLAYLLGRAGVPVTLVEAHSDFDRDFRGDSLHPYTLELLDQLGLAEHLLTLPHHRVRYFRLHTPAGLVTTADYGKLQSRFNYVALMPQARFLEFLAHEIDALPGCQVRTGCKVTDLMRDERDRVVGVRYRDATGVQDLPTGLVVGTDGRFSRVRRLSDLPAHSLGASTDLLWFRLPRRVDDPPDADVDLFFGRNHYVGLLAGPQGWQVGYTMPKGGYPAARAAGVEPIRSFVAEHIPWLADRNYLLTDFCQTTLLSVDIARVDTWRRPGLLLLGDAAHVISPVGGNGILMAIQDAVVAANHLARPLRDTAPVPDQVLAAVQAEREPAIRRVQADQVRIERRVARARATGRPIAPPRALKLITAVPGVRARAARSNAYGPTPPRLERHVVSHPARVQPIRKTRPMSHNHRPANPVVSALDVFADRSVLVGYSRLGYQLRRRHWPSDDPGPDALAGRVAVVTGANSGLGTATTAGLAALGATVVMVVRDETRGHQARDQLCRELPGARLELQRCDLSDLDDVRALSARLLAEHPTLDVLVHNAGVLPSHRTETAQGHDLTLATHVLGPLLLTEGLRPALAGAADARVIWVSSGGMYTQSVPATDLEYRHGRYRGAVAYARTKRLQVALTPILADRYATDGIAVHALHPGWAATPGVADSLPGFHRLAGPLLRTPAEGADTTIWLAATEPSPPSGCFWHDRRTRPTHYLPGTGEDPDRLAHAWDYCRDAAQLPEH
jgi:2-polyprenyl-6-methoxyphenol hydroxylase-like FAD-dependent oxidoreductase/NAD(P)-dependent dehydrogenase (short-subunit alcohol dehydrogenase family)